MSGQAGTRMTAVRAWNHLRVGAGEARLDELIEERLGVGCMAEPGDQYSELSGGVAHLWRGG